METGAIQKEETQKDKISNSLKRLRMTREKANRLMDRLLNGDTQNDEPGIADTTPFNTTTFMSIWECLPDELDHINATISGILDELEKRLLG